MVQHTVGIDYWYYEAKCLGSKTSDCPITHYGDKIEDMKEAIKDHLNEAITHNRFDITLNMSITVDDEDEF